ncbi:MAG: 50S ribosomal protein L39e [Infirmifilum sp.]|jgi:large subunit ribosomal protein L39e|uniref:50S ribosomal protein L39e n=1 Tax=Infirmifilum TaxID=2856573 RepID=UPI000B0D4313|nr:50S ribosomal protein L39e [Infirmifilum uzonense]
MARNKPFGKKIRLIAAVRENHQIPIWVISKTLGEVRRKPRRNWRRSRMQL